MKKLLFGVIALGMLAACNTTEETANLTEDTNARTATASRKSCPSEEIRAELLKNDAKARARFAAIEAGTEKFIQAKKLGRVLADGTVEIPVVFNVLYRTSAENISDARIAEQIAVLNKDFGATNSDINKIPAEFASVAAGDTKVRFRLVKTVRKSTKTRSWRTNDAMKKASSGGIDATAPTQYFNIWVVGNMSSILGYATFPESAGQWNDGVVLADGTVEIPVVVNLLYRTTAENLSDARIAEQIAVLNKDFGATNSDVNKIPAEFASVAAGDTKVRFRLVKTVRKATSVRSWRTNDAMKKASTKGIDATNPTQYFNIWVVGDMGSILGYATFPESAGQWNDGVVLASKYTGVTGATAPYNLGRTATHEVGHYLNLRHIWGDATCGNDFVADTPTQTGS